MYLDNKGLHEMFVNIGSEPGNCPEGGFLIANTSGLQLGGSYSIIYLTYEGNQLEVVRNKSQSIANGIHIRHSSQVSEVTLNDKGLQAVSLSPAKIGSINILDSSSYPSSGSNLIFYLENRGTLNYNTKVTIGTFTPNSNMHGLFYRYA